MLLKAIAWCPWQPSILASGGGTADRQIRLWNAHTGACLQSTETNSQVILLPSSCTRTNSGAVNVAYLENVFISAFMTRPMTVLRAVHTYAALR